MKKLLFDFLSTEPLVCEREALLRRVFHRSLARLTRRAEALDERLAAAREDAHVVRRVPRREREQLALEVGPAELDAHAGGGSRTSLSPSPSTPTSSTATKSASALASDPGSCEFCRATASRKR